MKTLPLPQRIAATINLALPDVNEGLRQTLTELIAKEVQKDLDEVTRLMSDASRERDLIKAGLPKRVFPIQKGPTVPWEVMAPHDSMAQANHSQSLQRLSERGGLSSGEAWAVVSGIRLRGAEGPAQWEEYDRKWREFAERVNLHYAELETAQQQAAEMRRALLNIPCPNWGRQQHLGSNVYTEPQPCGWCEVCKAQKAVREDQGYPVKSAYVYAASVTEQTPAGRDWVRKEAAQTLADGMFFALSQCDRELWENSKDEWCPVPRAIATARDLGLEEK